MGTEFNGDIEEFAADFLAMPVITFLAEEGALDVTDRRIGASGAQDKTHGFATEIQIGDPVVVDPTQDITVKQRVAGGGTQTIVGFATTKSTPLEGVELTELLTLGNTPDPERLQIVIEVLAAFFRVVTLDDQGVAIVPGDGVRLSSTQIAEWTKGTANNGTLVLTLADDDETFGVLIGHVGVFS